MATLLMIGAGGLGCGTLLGLLDGPPSAALDHIRLVDPDRVERSNLHRQILYTEEDLGEAKVLAAHRKMQSEKAPFNIIPLVRRLEGVAAIVEQAADCDLIIDGSDNFTTRFDANDAALQLGIPLVHGAAIGLRGQLMTVFPGRSACLRCLFDGPPEEEAEGGREASCRSEGVLGPLVGEVGWLMALEVTKILRQEGQPLTNQLLTLDAHRQRRRRIPLRRRESCPGCSRSPPAGRQPPGSS